MANKNYYWIDFKWCDGIYCSNIVHAYNMDDVKKAYSEYEWMNVRDVQYGELEMAKRKGMPFIEVDAEGKIDK